MKTAANAKEEEALYRELVRRFPGEGKYAVALGRSLIDVGKLAPARATLQRVVDAWFCPLLVPVRSC